MNLQFLCALAVFVVAGSFFLILVLTPLAKYFGLIDSPNQRKQHLNNIPMVGGLAIYTIVILTITPLSPSANLLWMIFTGSMLVAVGAIDDSVGVGIRLRLIVQSSATLLMIIGTGLWIRSVGLELPLDEGVLNIFGVLLTFFGVVALTNSFNMTDGIDGLAAGYMLVGLSVVSSLMLLEHGFIPQSEWLVILSSSVFSFWLVNVSLTPFKKVFLGDAGSLLLGYVMAWTLIYYSQEPIALVNPVAALWCVALPVYDTCSVIVRRITARQSPFVADRRHLHHLLMDFGFDSKSTLALLMASSAIISSTGVWITLSISPDFGLSVFLIVLIVGITAEHILGLTVGSRD